MELIIAKSTKENKRIQYSNGGKFIARWSKKLVSDFDEKCNSEIFAKAMCFLQDLDNYVDSLDDKQERITFSIFVISELFGGNESEGNCYNNEEFYFLKSLIKQKSEEEKNKIKRLCKLLFLATEVVKDSKNEKSLALNKAVEGSLTSAFLFSLINESKRKLNSGIYLQKFFKMFAATANVFDQIYDMPKDKRRGLFKDFDYLKSYYHLLSLFFVLSLSTISYFPKQAILSLASEVIKEIVTKTDKMASLK